MKILFYGDSITDMERYKNGDNLPFSYGFGYPFLISAELLKVNPEKYQIINRGISGNRVVDIYARIKKDVWNENPDVISILIGTNDVWHEIMDKNGVDLDRFERIYKMLLDDTKKRLPSVKIILLEPFVLHGTATDEHYEEFSKIREYAKLVKKIAKDNGCVFVPLQKLFDEYAEKHGASNYLYDGVHPNVAGAKIIADEWLKTFNKEII